MPRPYSTDLRERAVEAVESGASRREIAEIFKVGVSSVIRWCQRWSETGSAAPKRSSGSVSPLEEHSDWILALVAKQPDLILEEVLAAMAKHGISGGRSGSPSVSLIDTMLALKKSLHAAERNEPMSLAPAERIEHGIADACARRSTGYACVAVIYSRQLDEQAGAVGASGCSGRISNGKNGRPASASALPASCLRASQRRALMSSTAWPITRPRPSFRRRSRRAFRSVSTSVS